MIVKMYILKFDKMIKFGEKVPLTCAIGIESDNHADKSLHYSQYKFLRLHRVWTCALLTLGNYVFFRLWSNRVSCVFAANARRYFCLLPTRYRHEYELSSTHRLENGTWCAVYYARLRGVDWWSEKIWSRRHQFS